MKKIIALILVLMMILPLAVACGDTENSNDPSKTQPSDSDTNGEGSADEGVEVDKLNGKTPKELYDATITALSKTAEYDVIISTISSVHLLADEPTVSKDSEEYLVNNGEAYMKYTSAANHTNEIWFKDGSMYVAIDGEDKQRTQMSAETFASNYLLNISSVIFPLADSYFTNKKFTKTGEEFFLTFAVTSDDYMKYMSAEISSTAEYKICFDSLGNIKWANLFAVIPASNSVNIERENRVEFKALGEADEVVLDGEIEDYRYAPSADEIVLEQVDSLDKFTASESETDYVMIEVEGKGTIVIQLFADVAPGTVANFKGLVAEGFYNGLIFHRVSKDFVIQGGDRDGDGVSGVEDAKIDGEFVSNGFFNNLSHFRGVVSMARLSQDYNSASTQFFIMQKDNFNLDGKYAAFGYVVYGMDVVDAIIEVEVDEAEKPTTDVVMTSVKFVTYNK